MNYSFIHVFIYLCIVTVFSNVYGQEMEPSCGGHKEKKAFNLFEKAKKNSVYPEAKKQIEEALEIDPEFSDAAFFIANRAKRYEDIKAAIKYYNKAIEICPEKYPEAYFNLGSYYFSIADSTHLTNYTDAIKYLEKFIAFEESPEELKNATKRKNMDDARMEAEKYLKSAKFLSEAFTHPVPFKPQIVEGISTPADEVLPIISPDHELAFYTRRYEIKSKGGIIEQSSWKEKFVLSELAEGHFNEGAPLPSPFNENNNEGGASITADNQSLYFTICKPDGTGYNNCDIYYSKMENGKWPPIKNIGPSINGTNTWEAQPSITADGKTLYFTSIREGNLGFSKDNFTADIYKSVKNEKGEWGKAENVGKPINTNGDEKSPFIHTDSQTLYFASNGHEGIGGYDIFFVKGNEKGKFEKPKNIGYPINTPADELSFFVSTDGKEAYFGSKRKNGKGGYDLYSFPLYKDARPEKVLFVKGTLTDENGKVLTDAKIQIKNMMTKEILEVPVDQSQGKYVAVITLKKEEDYVMTVKKDGYAFDNKVFSSHDSTFSQPSKVDVKIKPLEIGKAYTINNLNYASKSAELTENSKFILEQFMDYLKEYPKIKIAIYGHTDTVGDDEKNRLLSEQRALMVYNYLIANQIAAERLSYKGFGKIKPLTTNDTEEGRAKNRRTEFVIVAK